MRLHVTALVAVLVVAPITPSPASSLASTAAAGSAADTCFGLAPTIVGTPDGVVTGTDGPDVVITNSARYAETLGGDDAVCLTGTTPRADTGTGNDRVDDTESRHGSTVDLGGGSDTFVGGDDGSYVDAGDRDDFRAALPLGVDTIQTGAGSDTVITGNINVGSNADSVQLGDGADEASVRGAVSTVLDGGGGRDTIALTSTVRGDWTVDAASGSVTLDGVPMPAAASFTVWELAGLSWDSLVFRGSPAKDVVDVTRLSGVVRDGPFTARMGGGKDAIYARSQDTGPFSGGSGEDMLFVEAKGTAGGGGDTIVADLAADVLKLTGFDPVTIASIEGLSLASVDGARIAGDGRANRLSTFGCSNLIDGRAGDDRIDGEVNKNCYDEGGLGVTAYGGDGDDSLRGSINRDRLIGGPGRDKTDGGDGRDVCQAERRIRCEL